MVASRPVRPLAHLMTLVTRYYSTMAISLNVAECHLNVTIFLGLFCIAPAWCARVAHSAQVKTLILPGEDSTAPLWGWNDMLTGRQIHPFRPLEVD
jgi:hypothetical protein